MVRRVSEEGEVGLWCQAGRSLLLLLLLLEEAESKWILMRTDCGWICSEMSTRRRTKEETSIALVIPKEYVPPSFFFLEFWSFGNKHHDGL